MCYNTRSFPSGGPNQETRACAVTTRPVAQDAINTPVEFEKTACVILDIDLNDGSGIELRNGLKAAGVSVPVIYITGNETPAVREAALASGCVAFLTKPFSAKELIEPLKKASAVSS